MTTYSYGAGLWLFGQFIDRYATDAYGPPVSTVEAIRTAAEVGRLSSLDINIPFAGNADGSAETVADVKAALDDTGMTAEAITPAIYSRVFQKGAFTNPDPAVRTQAIDLCKEAIEVAGELGARYVKFWPGQDGHDYPWQVDHDKVWHDELDGIRQVITSAPEMQFAIEYKLKEPRLHMLLANAATTLLAIDEIGEDNLGVVMDFGHSLFAKEAPAAALKAIHRKGKLVSIELNDNRLEWDDDLTVGSNHPVETLEFLQAVREIGWDGPLLLDQFPFREDPVAAAKLSIETIDAMFALLDRLDLDAVDAARADHDAMASQRLVMAELLGGLGPR
ncbi:MAG: sugar phosphate isomerase/epimerase family protein [Acidimicrobiales bacterium]